MTTISSHLVRLREVVGGLNKRGARAQLSEQTLELTKGLLFFRAVGRGKQKETHGVFVKRAEKGWCNPAGVHLLQGTLAEDTFGETDLLVLVLDAETVKVLEAFGQVGFDAGGAKGHTMMPGVVRGNAPPSSQVSLSYSIIDGRAFVPAYLEHAVVQFRASSNAKFYGPFDVTLGRVLANADLRTSPEHAKMVEDCLRTLEAFFAAPPAAAASAAAAQEQGVGVGVGVGVGAGPGPGPGPAAKGDGSVKMPPQLKSAGSSLRRPPPVEQPLAGAAKPDSPPVSPNSNVGRQISFTF